MAISGKDKERVAAMVDGMKQVQATLAEAQDNNRGPEVRAQKLQEAAVTLAGVIEAAAE